MRPTPCALSIAGLDPSGGAGVFADLRAFAASSVWGCGAVALITVQSTAGVRSSHPVQTGRLLEQVREIFAHQNIRSVKIGALGSISNARGVARWLATVGRGVPVVLDPVMRPTRGSARLLQASACRVVLGMLKHVTVVTPNVPEAEALLRTRIRTVEDAERAAFALIGLGARAALVKGGHLPARRSDERTTDVLVVGARVLRLRAPRVSALFHGTGCVLSSLVAGKLAQVTAVDDDAIVDAVRWAKRKLRGALAEPLSIGDGLSVVA